MMRVQRAIVHSALSLRCRLQRRLRMTSSGFTVTAIKKTIKNTATFSVTLQCLLKVVAACR